MFAPSFHEAVWRPEPTVGGPRRLRKPQRYRATIPPLLAEATIVLDPQVARACADARVGVVEVDRVLSDDVVAVASVALLRSESVASSRIENLRVSNRGVALAVHDAGAARASAREAAGNVRAMVAAVDVARRHGRVDFEGILTIHRRLLEDTSEAHLGGVLRQKQSWIGGPNPANALYVPPPHAHVRRLMEDLVVFAARDDVDPIASVALAHAQFEAIHPFVDGNGRAGRCLVHALMRAKRMTTSVAIPVSAVLLARRDDYFSALAAYQRHGDAQAWVAYFAAATEQASRLTSELSGAVVELRAEWRARLGASRRGSVQLRLVDLLPVQPVVDADTVARALEVDVRTARRGLAALEQVGVLREVSHRRRGRVWAADELFDVLDGFQARVAREQTGGRGGAPSRHLRPAPGRSS